MDLLLVNRVLFLLLLFVCSQASATDLLQTYRLALVNDQTFRSVRYSLESTRQKIPQARASLLPTINVVGSKSTTKADTAFTNVPPVDRRVHSWSWTLQLTQPLVRLENLYAYQQSQYIVDQAEAQYEEAVQDLLLRVTQAYFGVSVSQEVIEASTAEIRSLEEQLEQVTRGFKAGTHSVIDVDETKSRLGLARSRLVEAQNDLEDKNAELEKMTGARMENLAVLQTSIQLPAPLPRDRHIWMEQARSRNPEVRAQQAAMDAAKSGIKRARAGYAPTLDLIASRGSNYSSNSLTTPNEFDTRANSSQIGLQLNIPIFSGGETNAKVTEAIALKNKAESDLEEARRQAALEAQQAFAGVVNGLAKIEALNYAKESGQSSVKGNRLAFKLGVRINLDVLDAEQQLYAARRDLAVARYQTLLHGMKLKAAVAALGEEDLLAINAMLVH